jgi:hypothetical protein
VTVADDETEDVAVRKFMKSVVSSNLINQVWCRYQFQHRLSTRGCVRAAIAATSMQAMLQGLMSSVPQQHHQLNITLALFVAEGQEAQGDQD